MKSRTKRKITPWLFLAPFLAAFLIFMAYPTVYSIVLSFMKFQAGKYTFFGLRNFRFLFTDPLFGKAIVNTLIFLVIQVPLQTLLALILANFLNLQRLRLKGLFRMFTFMPVLVDTISYSIVFLLLFNNNTDAIVNGFLGLFGVQPLQWMNVGYLAKSVIVVAVTWRWTGYNAVIILGGLQNISAELYEAASIDGASKVRQFFAVTLPGVKPVLTFSVVLSINGILQLFAEPNLITKGGPVNQTLTIVQYLYNTGFGSFNFGVASAGAYILAVMIGIFSFIQLRLTKED